MIKYPMNNKVGKGLFQKYISEGLKTKIRLDVFWKIKKGSRGREGAMRTGRSI